MTLQLRRKKDGSLASRYWYADFRVRGQRRVVALKVPVEGTLPDRKGKGGDADFYKSKGKAQHVHDETVREAHTKAGADKLVERLVEIKTGEKVRAVPLDKLVKSWLAIPRKNEPSPEHVKNRTAVLTRFIKYIHQHHPKAKELADLSAAQVRSFMVVEHERGLSARTWNMTLVLLRSVFRHLEPGADAYRKYLSTVPTKTESTIHREPFTADDITAIMEAAKDDDLMRPLITTALCTAMRRGDCALLKCSSVDMDAGFIAVKTSKTGETVEIPIMPMLRDELGRSLGVKDGAKDAYVWPEAAAMYQRNADGLNFRLRAILHRAGFIDAETAEKMKNGDDPPTLPALPPSVARQRGLEAINSMPMNEDKRQRIRQVFTRYTDGQSVKQVAVALQISTGTVSGLLNEVEQAIKAAVIRRPAAGLPAQVRGLIHADNRGQRLKRGSLRGWHSFRTTFITLALSAGLPMELVRRVTGHTTVDVVLKHYFRPGREDFKRALQAAMPKILLATTKPDPANATPENCLRLALADLEAMNARDWKNKRDSVASLIRQAQEWYASHILREGTGTVTG